MRYKNNEHQLWELNEWMGSPILYLQEEEIPKTKLIKMVDWLSVWETL
jgi:hypothetical protein